MNQLASDYESMKMKYFNVLTEKCAKDTEVRDLLKERETSINELYALRMDVNKKINLLEEKDAQIEALSKRLQCETERA